MRNDLYQLAVHEQTSAAGKIGGKRAAEALTLEERRERGRHAINARWERERARRAAAAEGRDVAEGPVSAPGGSAAQEATPAKRRRATPHQLRAALAIACVALERIAAGAVGADPRELARAALAEPRVRAARE